MYCKIGKLFQCLNIVMAALVMSAGAQASVDEQSLPTDRIATIVGKVLFERHHTLMPLNLCIGEACGRAPIYWSLVLYTEDSKYELNIPFARGSHEAPESVELGDVIVRQGTRLAIEANVQTVSAEYSILSDVQKVHVMMDHTSVNFYGWRCHSSDSGRGLYVHVARTSRVEDEYSMRILSDQASEDRMPQMVAMFEPIQMLVRDDSIIFDGNNQGVKAQLEINQNSDSLYRFDSRLVVSNQRPTIGQYRPAETVVDLKCDLTR